MLILSCNKSENEININYNIQSNVVDFPNGSNIYHYQQYSIDFNCEHKQSNWVYYSLTSNEVNMELDRTDDYREDTSIDCNSSLLEDFVNSGFDRGHLSPAADNRLSLEVMSESFLLTNISPQEPGFNRGIWLRLENQVRQWALIYDSLIVITGPVLTDSLEKLGNSVSIPKYFYKIVYAPSQNKMIAFDMANESNQNDISNFCVSVDSIEKKTGLDFFPNSNLDDIELSSAFW